MRILLLVEIGSLVVDKGEAETRECRRQGVVVFVKGHREKRLRGEARGLCEKVVEDPDRRQQDVVGVHLRTGKNRANGLFLTRAILHVENGRVVSTVIDIVECLIALK